MLSRELEIYSEASRERLNLGDVNPELSAARARTEIISKESESTLKDIYS